MERRESLVTIRANTREREQLAAVARHLGHTEADTFRLLVRREAERLGIIATNEACRPVEAGISTSPGP